MEEEKTKPSIVQAHAYLFNLKQQPLFRSLVLEPMEKQGEYFERVVKDPNATMEQIRAAQGGLMLYELFTGIWSKAERLRRKEIEDGTRRESGQRKRRR